MDWSTAFIVRMTGKYRMLPGIPMGSIMASRFTFFRRRTTVLRGYSIIMSVVHPGQELT